MSCVPIEKGIPILPSRRPDSLASRFALEDLGVGDSRFVQGVGIRPASAVASAAKVRLGRRFVCRTVLNNGVRGVRIWREA